MIRLNVTLGILCWPLLMAHADSLRLMNGESHKGKLAMAATGIELTSDDAKATFDLANVLLANFGEPAGSGTASFPAGVVLTNGSFVAGALKEFNGAAVKLGTPAQPIMVPSISIAAIVFAPIPCATILQIPAGKTGAILPNGDFFAGAFVGIKKNAAIVNSTLFGPHPFAINSQVSAVILRNLQAKAAARYEIGIKNGSRFFTNDVKIEKDALLLNDLILGPVKVGNAELAGIRAGSGRCQSLTEMKPMVVVDGAGKDAASSVSSGGGEEGSSTLSTPLNVAVTYAIPPGLPVFSSDIAVPKEAAAGARVTFAVYCDGRLLFRSIQVGSAIAAHPIRISCGAAQRIALRVEPAAPGSDAVVGQWITPMFLHP